MDSKKPWASGTLWIALVIALAGFFPDVQQFIVDNPGAVPGFLGAIFAILRILSQGKIDIKSDVKADSSAPPSK